MPRPADPGATASPRGDRTLSRHAAAATALVERAPAKIAKIAINLVVRMVYMGERVRVAGGRNESAHASLITAAAFAGADYVSHLTPGMQSVPWFQRNRSLSWVTCFSRSTVFLGTLMASSISPLGNARMPTSAS